MHHSMRMRTTILSSVACLTLPYFVAPFHNRYGLRENVTAYRMCILSFYTTFAWKFDVRESVHHHTIQINQPPRCNSFTSLLLDVYVWLNMFRAPIRPLSSEAYNCTRSLWFYRWREAAGALLVVVWQTTTNNAPTATLQR